MKAYVIHAWGGIDALKLEEVSKPTPAANEVLIKVKAIGMNPVDYIMRQGYVFTHDLQLPVILGCDVAGIVEAVGNEVTDLKIGDKVAGLINFPGNDGTREGRGFAEYVAAPANHVAKLPTDVSFEQGAGLSAVALTAKQALFDLGNLKTDQRVLIHGASGGVGHIAVQLAKNTGASVIATASEQHAHFVHDLGAEKVIDYKNEQFEDIVTDIDLVLNTVGGDVLSRSLKVLKKGGRLISLLPIPEEVANEAAKKGIIATFMGVRPSRSDLTTLLEDVAQSKLHIAIAETYPFDKLPKAETRLEKGSVAGKIVVVLDH